MINKVIVSAQKGWDAIYSEENLKLISKEVPSENLVRWFNRFVRKDLEAKEDVSVLDIGFGTGSDMEYFIKKGYMTYGAEVSDNALKHTAAKLNVRFQNAGNYKLMKYSERLPFEDGFFDFVYSMEVLHYAGTHDAVSRTVSEIYRVMKPGMSSIISIPGTKHQFARRADRIGLNEYVFNESYPEREGLRIFIPDDRDVLKNIFSEFGSLSIGHYEYSSNDNEVAFFWMIHARKV